MQRAGAGEETEEQPGRKADYYRLDSSENIGIFLFLFLFYICINFQSFWLHKIVCVLMVQMVFIALNKTIKYIKFEQHF